LDLATATLMKIRPYVRNISSVNYVAGLANGDLCVAVGYSGDIVQARARAREAKTGTEITYLIPKEGSIAWFEVLSIPDHAPNPASAYAFIDYLLTPQVIADITNATGYANANIAASALLLPEVRNDPAIYPPPDARTRLTAVLPDSPERLRALTRMWQRFKSGE
jgi:putrescine transport system substrate-binding protein